MHCEEVYFRNLRLGGKWETDIWNAEICAIVTKGIMCDLLLEGHYQNCNHENTTYVYYFMGNVTIAVTWELAF